MKNPYKTLSSKITYKNSYWHVVDNDIIRPDGSKGHYYVVKKCNAAAAVPLTEDNKFTYLVRQWRYPVNHSSWEFPMGGIDSGETPLMAAKRELREEAGITAKRWQKINTATHISNGLSTESLHAFVARDFKIEEVREREGSESDMEVKKFPLKKVYDMARNGEIKDGLTVLTLFYLQKYL
jgi:8-oxo-dGTP pyrophosphatase MutT (NUDIX family)